MYKKLLAVAVASSVAVPAMALTAYDDGTDKLTIGGRVGVQSKTMDGDTELNNDSARINFGFEHKFSEDLTGFAMAEWGINAIDQYDEGSKKDLFSNRLGNIGVAHSTYGKVTAGKQWSVYYDIAGWTDMYAIGGGTSMGIYDGYSTDGGVNGTGRADDAISYRASVGGLNVGLQYQMRGTSGSDIDGTDQLVMDRAWERTGGGQAALSYDFDSGLSVGYTYSQTSFEQRENAHAQSAGIKFDTEQMYLAATYGKFKNHTNATLANRKPIGDEGSTGYVPTGHFDKKSTGIELFGQYNLQSVAGLSFYAGLNQLKVDEQHDGSDSDGKLDTKSLGALYRVGPMQLAAEYTVDDSKKHDGTSDADNYMTLQARYYF
ncbi:porin [Endozoicomonas lisbonensis]|uniref:Porin n=1 Tax=Endozoicomonas lisbonensis TaxID=3120522 RepID=A0ABV2SDN3_9GAMM